MIEFRKWLLEKLDQYGLDPEHVMYDDDLKHMQDKMKSNDDKSTVKIKRKPINFGQQSTVIRNNQSGNK